MNKYGEILSQFETEGRLRTIPFDRKQSSLIDLCTNDYLGLSSHANKWRDEFHELFGYPAMTSSASRLLASDQSFYTSFEQWLEKAYKAQALLFNSGYHANVGLIQALNIPGTLWLTDKLIHASAIDGIRLSKAEFRRWNHNDAHHLQKIIEKEYERFERLIVLCESVYSMDGDIAPLEELCRLKREYPKIMLYVDEAHAVGCFGRRGLGICEQRGILSEIDIIVGTLGKALASTGAFVITRNLKEYLLNTSRSFIFSTSLPPVNVAWSQFMMLKSDGMYYDRERLKVISEKVRNAVETALNSPNPSRSAIIPIMTGNSLNAVKLSERLKKRNILALPIRRPTVPAGGERIRLSLHADLTDDDIEYICNVIKEEVPEICE